MDRGVGWCEAERLVGRTGRIAFGDAISARQRGQRHQSRVAHARDRCSRVVGADAGLSRLRQEQRAAQRTRIVSGQRSRIRVSVGKRLSSRADHLARRIAGNSVAIDLASRRPCAALVLEAPFTSASDVAGTVVPYLGPLLIRSFNSLPKIRWIRVPKLFMQGARDEVIPLQLGHELFAAAQGSKTFWIIPGAGHNDILEAAGAEYRHRLSAFYRSLLDTITPHS